MRKLLLMLVIGALCVGGWYYWKRNPQALTAWRGGEFHTFKMRYPAERIMEEHKKELLPEGGSLYLEPKLAYFPYLLMEVKYTRNEAETREGMLLWGLSDGEMVLDVTSWERSHGFEDCLLTLASKADFTVLRALAESGGNIEKAILLQKLSKEEAPALQSCVEKKLIVESGGRIRFHLQNPKFEIEPHTQLNEWVVTLAKTPSTQRNKRYSTSQILQLTEKAFGADFALRRTREVYLPVHEIVVQNSDGSLLTTYWNALTGKQVDVHL